MTTSKRKKALRKLTDALGVEIPGRVFSIEQLKVMSIKENTEACGWIRKPHHHEDAFYGTCALQDFNPCDYPCTLPSWKYQNKYEDFQCPAYKHFMKKQRS